jgi:hypothetical protein
MKKLVLFLFAFSMALLFADQANAQSKSLFVNDNGLISDNTDSVLTALTAAGIEYDVFNARDSLRSPTSAEMQAYPLVIWYCSTDGVGNYLWNNTDSDNTDLILYLETGGGLWLIGTDFLYDRYGSAPGVFAEGDFVFDFLGISEYNAQAYGDDGGLGVPELDPIPVVGSTLPHDTIRWYYSTAWWVDGCTPGGNAVSAYNMGPASYSLQGLSSAIWNYPNLYDGQKELTFLFDPALIDTYANRVALFEWSYSILFMPSPPGVKELPAMEMNLIMGQIPAFGKLQCKVPESAGSSISVAIYDINGKILFSEASESRKVFGIDISSINPGMYLLMFKDDKKIYCQKFVIGR